ncbi:hypothetical protein NBT05_02505 [Aquimarina sp. ERC-38]|uniref:hypothetical protein n=1 Tax=Aquimarina sp. ERC-38 TaxID=2949996 RepID=UPI0022453421|nr:hypothetical protein [Aquimarina sp. ERC-38]UZO81353.1 hypothetical protein NBT05_02505 [Aquimarina sp. ERC-38]
MLFPVKAQEKIALEKQYDDGQVNEQDYKVKSDILWEKYQVFGFTNMRRFLFAVGFPIALFSCSILMLFIARFSNDLYIKKGTLIGGTSFQTISLYFIIWSFWSFDEGIYDFSETTYYLILAVTSITLSIGLYFIFKSFAFRKFEIRELIGLTVILRKKLFLFIDRHESTQKATIEKEKIDNKVYTTFRKVVE